MSEEVFIRKIPSATWIVMLKEIKLLFKSKRRIMLLFMTPIIILLVASISAISTNHAISDVSNPQVWVINDSPSVHTENLYEIWNTLDIELIEVEHDYNEIITSNDFKVLVYIPANFTDLIANQSIAVMKIGYNSNSTLNQNLASQIAQLTLTYEQELIIIENPEVQFNRIELTVERNKIEEKNDGVSEDLAALILVIPVYIIFLVVIPPISLVLISVTIEREHRTLETLFLQPVKRRSIVLGKIAYGMLVVLITLILNILTVLLSLGIYSVILSSNVDISGGQILDFVVKEVLEFGFEPIIFFLASIIVISINIISLAVLLSLLAKDEKEANMIIGLIPILLFSIMIMVFFVPVGDFNIFGQLTIILVPIAGVLFGMYLSLLAGSVIPLAYISLFGQIVWAMIIVWVTTRISEAESILELTWGKGLKEIIRVLMRKNL
jgi:ABC-type Na+ efflux pump permease subunit